MAAEYETGLAVRSPSTWSQSVLAGLPHAVIAALLSLASLLPDTGYGNLLGWSLLALAIAAFLTAIFFAWRRHWPAWGASWFGYACLLVLILALLPSQGWNPPISQVLQSAGKLVLLALTLLTLRYWLTRRDPVEGLLIGFPVVILYWLPVTEFVSISIRMWLIGALFLACALGSGLILRKNSLSRGIWILLLSSLAGGIPLALARTYLHSIPVGYSQPASFHQVVGLFSPQFLAGAALALGPILGWGLWGLGKRLGALGRLGAALLIAGMVFNLFGLFSYWRWFDHLDYFDALGLPFLFQPNAALSIFLIYAGLACIVVGGLCLGALTWRQNPPLGLCLTPAALLLPHFAMFPVYSGFHISMPGFPLNLNGLTPAYKSSVLGIAILLLLVVAWTISRLYRGPQPSPGNT